MPAKKPSKKQPAAKREQEKARPPAERAAEYEATMKANREGYMAYERAHLAMRAGKLSATKAEKIKAEHREAHRLYWHAYEKARALKKAMPAAAREGAHGA
jgi:hypothetical protein